MAGCQLRTRTHGVGGCRSEVAEMCSGRRISTEDSSNRASWRTGLVFSCWFRLFQSGENISRLSFFSHARVEECSFCRRLISTSFCCRDLICSPQTCCDDLNNSANSTRATCLIYYFLPVGLVFIESVWEIEWRHFE